MKYEPEDWENYDKGVRLFNREKFFEAHEAWEEIWKRTTDEEDKIFLQGLIQAAAFLLHIQKKDGGGRDLYGASLEKLQGFRRGYWGADIQKLLEGLEAVRQKGDQEEEVKEYPKLSYLKKAGESR